MAKVKHRPQKSFATEVTIQLQSYVRIAQDNGPFRQTWVGQQKTATPPWIAAIPLQSITSKHWKTYNRLNLRAQPMWHGSVPIENAKRVYLAGWRRELTPCRWHRWTRARVMSRPWLLIRSKLTRFHAQTFQSIETIPRDTNLFLKEAEPLTDRSPRNRV